MSPEPAQPRIMPPIDYDDEQHELFMSQGYLRLGRVLDAERLATLQQRIDDIMMGRVRYEHLRMQLHDQMTNALRRTMGHEVATLSYRRIDDLEQDPVFLAYMQSALFEQIARRLIGTDVSVFRSMFMNKPAHWDQTLPWHQDVGDGWGIDDNPIMAIWTALDTADADNGGMQIVPGSHLHGVINEQHFLAEEEVEQYAPPERVIELGAEAGEAILLHNLLLHRSGPNPTSKPRRAFSATYMKASTKTLDTGQRFPVLFGQDALDPVTVGGKAADLVQRFYG